MDVRSIVAEFKIICALRLLDGFNLLSAIAVTPSNAFEGLNALYAARCLLHLGSRDEKHRRQHTLTEICSFLRMADCCSPYFLTTFTQWQAEAVVQSGISQSSFRSYKSFHGDQILYSTLCKADRKTNAIMLFF